MIGHNPNASELFMTLLPFRLAVICGGPSQERGISLNSARSVLDHLSRPEVEIIPIFVDWRKKFYLISTGQLYSNTPSDFDFKLNNTGNALDDEDLQKILRSVDLVFPVIHGNYGEDGELQELLESLKVPFVGHSSACCKGMFNKHIASEKLRAHGFPTLPQLHLKNQDIALFRKNVAQFFERENLTRAIVKPAIGGSSIDVFSVSNALEACSRLEQIFLNNRDEAIVEAFCVGKEFTIVVFPDSAGKPTALIPTEIELSYTNNQIFDFRKKYLPSNQAAYYTPPRFPLSLVERIRSQAEQLYELFDMGDFVRLDGWVSEDGTLYFTDINPVSGLEQNSFLFRQTALLGLTHRETLEYVIKNSCHRFGINFPTQKTPSASLASLPVYVVFGNNNAERQVSLMSGTNVWLKLLQSNRYAPLPFLYDHEGKIWELPYSYTLNHTVEEIYANCLVAHESTEYWQDLTKNICRKLDLPYKPSLRAQPMSQHAFLQKAQNENAFIFIAMHGSEGENGTLQRALEEYRLRYNGSDSKASTLCMDKLLTGLAIQALDDPFLQSSPKKTISFADFLEASSDDFERCWNAWTTELQTRQLIIKPRFDGCSAGIVLLEKAKDFQRYFSLLRDKATFIPAHTFAKQDHPIEMSSQLEGDFILESYIETDAISVKCGKIHHLSKKGWVELTVGILEKQGRYQAFNPSITIAEGAVLSLEEKFQGGTGINLTPPPEEIISAFAVEKIKISVIKAAKALGIQNYARLDIFYNRLSEVMILIEANSLPGLTPSTVIYHQGLAEDPPLSPLNLLETIISCK